MKHLLDKYRSDTITPEELGTMRQRLSTLSDDEAADILQSDWEEFMAAYATPEHFRFQRYSKGIIATAACIAAVVVACAAMLIMTPSESTRRQALSVFTSAKETSSVKLPDGSELKLNGSSSLSCPSNLFDTGKRVVSFSGEGYFKIAPDKKRPFKIYSGDLTITVLGTEFNFSSRDNSDCATLYLVAGTVEMHSRITDDNIRVSPGEKAEFNKTTGKFTVTTPGRNENITSWYTGEINFDSQPLDSVILFLERQFDCSLRPEKPMPDKDLSTLRFTGTLPTGNLPLALRTIEEVYGIRLTKE